MKASTLFALTVALILAMGTAAAARMMGLFSKTNKPSVQEPEIKVLVARSNLFEGIAITADMVRIRNIRAEEKEFYQKNRDKFLPATLEAATLRIPIRNIESDQPILKTDLEDLSFPEGLPYRLGPNMSAVNLSVPKERAAGGLIAKGDRVDVLLTSRVVGSENPNKSVTLSAYIARGLRVVAKRNSLWTVLKTNPDNRPVDYTLEANLYRAALLEFALNKGNISLIPSAAERKDNDLVNNNDQVARDLPTPDSAEYRDDDKRVEQMRRGELSITEADLERIFGLKPLIVPPSRPPVVIEQFSGTRRIGQSIFNSDGTRLDNPVASETPSDRSSGPQLAGPSQPLGYRFSPLSGSSGGSSRADARDCPSCRE